MTYEIKTVHTRVHSLINNEKVYIQAIEVARQAKTYPGFWCIKRLGVFLLPLDRTLFHHRVFTGHFSTRESYHLWTHHHHFAHVYRTNRSILGHFVEASLLVARLTGGKVTNKPQSYPYHYKWVQKRSTNCQIKVSCPKIQQVMSWPWFECRTLNQEWVHYEKVFHWISKHLEFRQKYYPVRLIFNSLLRIWISQWNTVSCVWYITSKTGQ